MAALRAVFFFLLLAPLRAAAAAPKLTVVFVVDQMRPDYLTRFSSEFTGAFARIVKQGAVFEQARQGHVPTETSVGHSALSTGRFPAQHGIMGNEWWDRAQGKKMYCVADSTFDVSPANLLSATLGDELKAASPASQVVSISGKDRAAILMGGKKADLVLWYNRSAGQFVTSGFYGRLPDWVWAWDAALRILPAEREPLIATPRFDQLVLQLARRAVEERKLGGGTAPDLLWISLSATDYTGHKFGPDSPQMHEQLVTLDKELGGFLDFLDARLGAGNYTAALSADHGVGSIPEGEAAAAAGYKRVLVPDLQQTLEAGLGARLGPPKEGTWVLAISPPHLYLNDALAEKSGVGADRLRGEAAAILEKNPAFAHVFRPEELLGAQPSKVPFFQVFKRSYFPGRAGDLMLLVKRGVLLTYSPYEADHGAPYDYDARVPLVFWGGEIRPGRHAKPVLATDLAPTLARVLEIPFSPATGSRVLGEALDDAASRHAAVTPLARP